MQEAVWRRLTVMFGPGAAGAGAAAGEEPKQYPAKEGMLIIRYAIVFLLYFTVDHVLVCAN
jgi:hypothetical protein